MSDITGMNATDERQTRVRRATESATASDSQHEAFSTELGSVALTPLMNGKLRARGNAPVRSALLRGAQQTHGNRAAQRYIQRMASGTPASLDQEDLSRRIDEKTTSGGSPIDDAMRRYLESGLGGDMSRVRVHTDAEADYLSRSMEAVAFTTGQDIFFSAGSYAPNSPAGLRLLAHEAAHTVQQEQTELAADGDTSPDAPALTLSESTDASEMEAEKAASRAVAGERTQISTKPAASVSRFGWKDAFAMGGGGVIGQVASAFMGPDQPPAPDAAQQQDAGLWGNLKRGWGAEVKAEQDRSNEIDKFRGDAIDNTVDWLEGQAHKGGQAQIEATKDIPVLGTLAKGSAAVTDFSTELMGGFIKGAGNFAGGVASMAANPIGTTKGLWAMGTHIPGIGLPAKILDKGIDVATGDKKLGDAFDETLGSKATEDDAKFWKGVGGHFLKPYGEAIDKGKYGEVAGRAIFDIGTIVAGAGEAGAAGKAAETGDAANAAAKVVEGAEGANAIPKSVPPPSSGVPTVRNPTPVFEPPPGSVPPSKLVPSEAPPSTILPPAPVEGPPTLRTPGTDIPPAPSTVPSPPPSHMPEPPSLSPTTEPAPSNVPPSTIPSPPEHMPTHHPPSPGDLTNPLIPKYPEPAGWAEYMLELEKIARFLYPK